MDRLGHKWVGYVITKIPLNTQNNPNTLPTLPKLPIYPWTSKIIKIPLEMYLGVQRLDS